MPVTCKLMGGLGNQLFQIFTTLVYAIENNKKIVFPFSEYLFIGNKRKTYWKTLLNNILGFTTYYKANGYENIDKFITYKEPNFQYNKITTFDGDNIILDGYFQSYKYFNNYSDTIFKIIKLDQQKRDVLKKEPFKTSEECDDIKYHNISMHFRLGDYKQLQDFHPIIPYGYYDSALSNIIKKRKNKGDSLFFMVYYFCESEDIQIVKLIINKLQEDYPKLEFIKINNDKYEDWEQVLLMSCCDDNIIANSTFSWWGAYFNDNNDKIVCYPYVWFGKQICDTNTTEDLFPDDWTKITY